MFGEKGRIRAASALGPSLPRSRRFEKVVNQHNYVGPTCADPAMYDPQWRVKCAYCGCWVKRNEECKLCLKNEKLHPVGYYVYEPPVCPDPAEYDTRKRVKCDSCGCWRFTDGDCKHCTAHQERMKHCLCPALLEGPLSSAAPAWSRKACPACQRWMVDDFCKACTMGTPKKRISQTTSATQPPPSLMSPSSTNLRLRASASAARPLSARLALRETADVTSRLNMSTGSAISTAPSLNTSKDTMNDVRLLHRSLERRALNFTTSSSLNVSTATASDVRASRSAPRPPTTEDIRYCGQCGCLKDRLRCPVCNV